MYDIGKTYVITGVVTRADPNPNHLQLFFAPLNEARDQVLRDDKGEPIVWAVEMDGAGGAARQGISVNNFPRGTIMTSACIRCGTVFRPAAAPIGVVQVPREYATGARQALRFGRRVHVARRGHAARADGSGAAAEAAELTLVFLEQPVVVLVVLGAHVLADLPLRVQRHVPA